MSEVETGRAIRTEMPDWKPILMAPVVAVLCWFIAYWVADHRGAPEGDTNFSWLPFLPMIVGSVWLVVAAALVLLRWVLIAIVVNGSTVVSVLAAIANLAGVALIYGETLRSTGGEGWPRDSVAIGALGMAGLFSLAVTAWLWRSRQPARA